LKQRNSINFESVTCDVLFSGGSLLESFRDFLLFVLYTFA
jgi:hypothetical protein